MNALRFTATVLQVRTQAIGRGRWNWSRANCHIKSLSVQLEGEQPQLSLRIDFVLEGNGKHKPAFVDFDITDTSGLALMQAQPVLEGFVHPEESAQSFQVLVDLPPLIPGLYWVSAWVGSHNTETLDRIPQCVAFEVKHSPTLGRTFPHTADHGYIVPPSRLLTDLSRCMYYKSTFPLYGD